MGSKITKALKYVLSFGLAAVLVFFAFRKVDWQAFWNSLKRTDWFWIGMSVVVSLLALLFRQLRWHMMLFPFDDKVRQIDVWDADNIGNLANIALPGAGEVARGALMSSPRAKYDKVFGTIIMERVWDFVAIILLVIIALAMMWNTLGDFFLNTVVKPAAGNVNIGLGWALIALLALLAVFIRLMFAFRKKSAICEKIASFIEGMANGFVGSLKIKNKFMFFIYTVLIWLMYVLTTYFTFLAMPELRHLGFGDALFLSAIGNFASIIPVPGGIGAYHYLVTVTLTSLYSTSWNLGILFATLTHEIHALILIVTGVISYICWNVRKKSVENR